MWVDIKEVPEGWLHHNFKGDGAYLFRVRTRAPRSDISASTTFHMWAQPWGTIDRNRSSGAIKYTVASPDMIHFSSERYIGVDYKKGEEAKHQLRIPTNTIVEIWCWDRVQLLNRILTPNLK